ncbi:beta-glucosidase 18-like isoform X2 [Chenopodium quinoa]|uniref:beta-glucosidase 18-like isoform X2 n=1 Tax=Chenopodium quinoa TaxID=63459 RepID=UPI000B7801FB|nr:beta-glucosidase 18-like isoform X2 [Chenopodium quinoa]
MLLQKTLLSFFFFSLLLLVQSKHNHEVEEEEEVVTRSMFPDDFIFGVATSAYQIEGAYLEDGKSLNNWDVFTHHPGGRFGEINPSGLMFYNNIIDNLLLKGIEPFVTIHHFDLPQELEDRYGGWLSPHMQEEYVYFAKLCFEKFGDRVKNWMTINEPNVFTQFAYMRGTFPPRRCSLPFGNCSAGNSDVEPLIAAHNMLIAHAKAVKLYRNHFQPKQGGIVGLTANAFHYEPYTNDEFSYQAVERSYAFNVDWIFDPLIYGNYPALMRKYLGKDLPKFSKEEVELLKGSIDFIGINHYSTFYALDCFNSNDCTSTENRAIGGYTGRAIARNGIPIGDEMGVFGFRIVPYGMEKLLNRLSLRYPNTSIYITENGYCPPNYQEGTELLQDFTRIKFHQTYLASMSKAMRKGAKVKGYFVWSFMDNFEWIQGYNITFGLYYVDRNTMKRTPRLSAKWFKDFIANGEKSSTISTF